MNQHTCSSLCVYVTSKFPLSVAAQTFTNANDKEDCEKLRPRAQTPSINESTCQQELPPLLFGPKNRIAETDPNIIVT